MKRRARKSSPGAPASADLLKRIANILVASGASPATLQKEFAAALTQVKLPKARPDPARTALLAEAPHVLTHWYTDPAYLDAKGQPRPLPLRGKAPSIQALIKRINRTADVQAIAGLLLRSSVLKRRGTRYVPTGRKIVFDPKDVSASLRALTGIDGISRTLDYNLRQRGKRPGLFEYTAVNPHFPVAMRASFDRRLWARGMDFLQEVDSEMKRWELRAPAKGKRVKLGVGLFLFEEPDGSAKAKNLPNKRSPRGYDQ